MRKLHFAIAMLAVAVLVLPGCVSQAPAETGRHDFHLLAADGWRISASEYEPESPNGVGIVLVHQLQGSKADWDALATAAAKRGFHVVAIDLRGHGGSASPKSFESFSERDYSGMPQDVRAAIDYAFSAGDTRVVPIGASIGANAALIASALDTRIGSVILVSPGGNYHGLDATAPAAGFDGRLLAYCSAGDDYGLASSRRMFSGTPRFRLEVVEGSAHGVKLVSGRLWQDMLDFASGSPPA